MQSRSLRSCAPPRRAWFLALILALGLGFGCDEFATPAELAAPQILAIRAEPPAVTPGGTVELEILVADQGGPVSEPDVTWDVAPTVTGAPVLGQVAALAPGRARYTAPADVAENPTIASVVATVRAGQGDQARELVALKGVVIGSLPLVNPTLTAFTVDGQDALGGTAEIRLARGQTAALELATTPAIDDMSTFAWYSTVGEIERYQSNPTELVAGEEAGAGWVIGVMRDGRGGVVWRALPAIVE